MNIKRELERLKPELQEFFNKHKKIVIPATIVTVLLSGVFLISKVMETNSKVFHIDETVNFDSGRVLDSDKEIYKLKGRTLTRTVRDLKTSNQKLNDELKDIKKMVQELKDKKGGNNPSDQAESERNEQNKAGVQFGNSVNNFGTTTVSDQVSTSQASSGFGSAMKPIENEKKKRRKRRARKGPSIISFPVKPSGEDEIKGITLPTGSFVKGVLMTGLEAPEGKTYPVLVALQHAYIAPNDHRVDLSGCFMIVKGSGDLSTERVQMQAHKLSCVSKKGRMFEREISAFVADDSDQAFAVKGEVSSKRDRVFMTALLSKIVEGIGKHVKNAQKSNTRTYGPNSSDSTSQVTGDEMKYIAGGAAADSASMVTSWYLKHAESLLPTIIVKSSQPVWVIMQDKVKLPNWYFRKNNGKSSSVYTFFSNITD